MSAATDPRKRPIRLYGIPNCDTVKRARAWLAEQGLLHEFVDFKKVGASATDLSRWSEAVGWEKLLNRQGTTWRKLDAATQAQAADAAGAQRLMQAQVSLIKRPVVDWPDGVITIGFSPEAWVVRAAVQK